MTADAEPAGKSVRPARSRSHRGPELWTWGRIAVEDPGPGQSILLGLNGAELPPGARLSRDAQGAIDAHVDELGFFHVYVRQLPGVATLSTSARALASLPEPGLDPLGVATQSLLGWQLGTRTMFSQVTKVAAGEAARLDGGRLRLSPHEPADHGHRGSTNPAAYAADLLREVMNQLLDQHDDLEVQLTGGLDSRILLAAVPPARRAGLRVMTLEVPGSADAAIAARLAARYGLDHRVTDLAGLGELSPAEAFDLVLGAARRVDSASDPVALAAVDFAERALPVTTRVAGLGGEVARGFYYFGRVRRLDVTRARTSALARWRMFSNEAAPREMFSPDFGSWSTEAVVDELYDVLRATGLDWFRATDAVYLEQRMQRWAGVLASATTWERTVLNPMLDARFLGLVTALPPEEKQGMRFLSRVLLELDPEMAAVPMDGRPAPSTYAGASVANRARILAHTSHKVVRKAAQRARRRPRSPEGGEVLAALVLRHLRDRPKILEDLPGQDLVDPRWVEQVLQGAREPGVAGVSMLMNLVGAGSLGDPADLGRELSAGATDR